MSPSRPHLLGRLAAPLLVGTWMCAGAASAADADCPPRLRVAFPDFAVPPIFHGTGAEFPDPPGQLVEFVRRAVQQSGCSVALELVRRPIRRMYFEAEHQEVDWVGMASHTPERAQWVVFPQHQGAVDTRLAVYAVDSHLYKLKTTVGVQWDGHTLRLPPGTKVGVPAGTAYETLARQYGWEMDLANGGPQALDKLLAGRTPAVVISDATVWGMDDAKETLLEALPVAVDTTYYFAAPSQAFFSHHPQFSRRVWQAMCEMARAERLLPDQKRLPRCPR